MAKRPVARAAAKRTAGTKAKAKARPPSKSKPAKKAPGKVRRTVTVVVPQTITLSLPPVLHDRLKTLSQVMGLSMEGVLRQALAEFAETWEEHHRTVAALAEGSDRVQLAMKD